MSSTHTVAPSSWGTTLRNLKCGSIKDRIKVYWSWVVCIDADGTSLAAFSYRARAPVCPVCPVCPSLTIPLQMIDHGRMLQMGMCLPIDGTSTNWNSSKIAIHPPKTIKGSLNPPACTWEKKTCKFADLKYIIIHTHTTLQQMTYTYSAIIVDSLPCAHYMKQD